jgi:hypothetical protein
MDAQATRMTFAARQAKAVAGGNRMGAFCPIPLECFKRKGISKKKST